MVVSINELACLDALLWLRTGERAASRLQLSQPAVSRNSKRALEALGLKINRQEGEWQLNGDVTMLDLAHQLHQHHRWQCQQALRLDAQYYSGPLLCSPAPKDWILGCFDFMEVHTPLRLLREGILDAWIGVYPDLPDPSDTALTCIHLSRMPTHLVVAEGHPLLALGDAIRLDDVKQYPSLSLPDGAFPKVQARLQKLGLWSSPSRIRRYRQDLWEGRTLDQLTVGYATAFTMRLFDLPQVVLPIRIDCAVGDSIVVKRCYAEHPRLHELLRLMKDRLGQLAREIPELTVL